MSLHRRYERDLDDTLDMEVEPEMGGDEARRYQTAPAPGKRPRATQVYNIIIPPPVHQGG